MELLVYEFHFHHSCFQTLLQREWAEFAVLHYLEHGEQV